MSGEMQFFLAATRRVSADRFYAIILVITFLIGVKLTCDAVVALV